MSPLLGCRFHVVPVERGVEPHDDARAADHIHRAEQGDALDTDATFGRAEEEDGGEVIDLMEALRASVERSRAARAEKDEPKKKAPAKKKTSKAS